MAITHLIVGKTNRLKNGKLSEPDYIEDCLWLSLEAMIKLLSLWFSLFVPAEYGRFIRGASQFAFEYGRYVLYAKEQAILEEYIQNQYALNAQLQDKYASYLTEVQAQADIFNKLVNNAFSPSLHESLLQSAELARKAGVPEEELLTTIDDVDDFFLN